MEISNFKQPIPLKTELEPLGNLLVNEGLPTPQEEPSN